MVWHYALPGRRVVVIRYDHKKDRCWAPFDSYKVHHVNQEARREVLRTHPLSFRSVLSTHPATILFNPSIDTLYLTKASFTGDEGISQFVVRFMKTVRHFAFDQPWWRWFLPMIVSCSIGYCYIGVSTLQSIKMVIATRSSKTSDTRNTSQSRSLLSITRRDDLAAYMVSSQNYPTMLESRYEEYRLLHPTSTLPRCQSVIAVQEGAEDEEIEWFEDTMRWWQGRVTTCDISFL